MRYFWLTIKHKWFVFIAGLRTKAPLWRLLIHDWTKFLPCELPHYQRQFFGKADSPYKYIKCWLHHQNSNPHHWEYWIPRTGYNKCKVPYPDNSPIAMPDWAVREMVADWLGASRAYEGHWPSMFDWVWLKNHIEQFRGRLHPQTWFSLENVLTELHCPLWYDCHIYGYEGSDNLHRQQGGAIK